MVKLWLITSFVRALVPTPVEPPFDINRDVMISVQQFLYVTGIVSFVTVVHRRWSSSGAEFLSLADLKAIGGLTDNSDDSRYLLSSLSNLYHHFRKLCCYKERRCSITPLRLRPWGYAVLGKYKVRWRDFLQVWIVVDQIGPVEQVGA